MADETDTTQTNETATQQTEADTSGAADQTSTTETTTEGAETGAEGDSTILGGDSTSEDEKVSEGEGDKAEEKPEPPETYELTPPEGFEKLDDETINEATPVFKELGLSNDQANKLMPLAGKFAERIQSQQQQQIMDAVVEQRAAWAKEAKDDPEIGGAKFEETVQLAAKALDALGAPKGSEFRNYLTDSGLGNHPEMIRMFRKIGEHIGEDNDFIRADSGAPIKKSREEVLYPDDVKREGAN